MVLEVKGILALPKAETKTNLSFVSVDSIADGNSRNDFTYEWFEQAVRNYIRDTLFKIDPINLPIKCKESNILLHVFLENTVDGATITLETMKFEMVDDYYLSFFLWQDLWTEDTIQIILNGSPINITVNDKPFETVYMPRGLYKLYYNSEDNIFELEPQLPKGLACTSSVQNFPGYFTPVVPAEISSNIIIPYSGIATDILADANFYRSEEKLSFNTQQHRFVAYKLDIFTTNPSNDKISIQIKYVGGEATYLTNPPQYIPNLYGAYLYIQ